MWIYICLHDYSNDPTTTMLTGAISQTYHRLGVNARAGGNAALMLHVSRDVIHKEVTVIETLHVQFTEHVSRGCVRGVSHYQLLAYSSAAGLRHTGCRCSRQHSPFYHSVHQATPPFIASVPDFAYSVQRTGLRTFTVYLRDVLRTLKITHKAWAASEDA